MSYCGERDEADERPTTTIILNRGQKSKTDQYMPWVLRMCDQFPGVFSRFVNWSKSLSRMLLSRSAIALTSCDQLLKAVSLPRMFAATCAPQGGGCACIVREIALSCDSILGLSVAALVTTDRIAGLSEYRPMA